MASALETNSAGKILHPQPNYLRGGGLDTERYLNWPETDWVNAPLSGLSVTVKQTVAVRCTDLGGDEGTPYVSPRSAAIGMIFRYLFPIFSKVAVRSDH